MIAIDNTKLAHRDSLDTFHGETHSLGYPVVSFLLNRVILIQTLPIVTFGNLWVRQFLPVDPVDSTEIMRENYVFLWL
ncbi:hypothetical protein DO97_21265 [Neosynechococcus sphagnicola sy1]|uniref:Uncharacterized protein n=1 Tax=Neosynechococcus sphagnicola sy1 TaxID=1497020 RepID=A0A098TM45_9CYAN|nr:hypothetical protein DO97_21265 [Neosynechococcus sphagnicola sy1]